MADVERTRRILAIELLLKRIMTLQHEQDVARETIAEKDKLIERLVEDGEGMAGVILRLKNYMSPDGNYSFCAKGGGLLGMVDQMLIGQVCEDGDNALDQHTALLAELEGKGPQLTESHGK